MYISPSDGGTLLSIECLERAAIGECGFVKLLFIKGLCCLVAPETFSKKEVEHAARCFEDRFKNVLQVSEMLEFSSERPYTLRVVSLFIKS